MKTTKIVCMLLCLVMLLSMAACSSGKTTPTNTEPESTPANVQIHDGAYNPTDEAPVKPADLEYTLSEYLATGETIWYMIDKNEGKDSHVKRILVINPDGTLYAMRSVQYTLGELEQMDDADIATMVKTESVKQSVDHYAFYMETDAAEALSSLKQDMIRWDVFKGAIYELDTMLAVDPDAIIFDYAYYEDIVSVLTQWQDCMRKHGISENLLDFCYDMLYKPQSVPEEHLVSMVTNGEITAEDAEALKAVGQAYEDLCKAYYDSKHAEIEAFVEAAKPCPYHLVIITDSTGNNTSYMELVYQTTQMDGKTDIDALPLSYIYPAGQNHSNSTTVVYDSIFGGYHNDGDYLFTRVSDHIHFTLDTVGTYDLPVDVKDYKSLFD